MLRRFLACSASAGRRHSKRLGGRCAFKLAAGAAAAPVAAARAAAAPPGSLSERFASDDDTATGLHATHVSQSLERRFNSPDSIAIRGDVSACNGRSYRASRISCPASWLASYVERLRRRRRRRQRPGDGTVTRRMCNHAAALPPASTKPRRSPTRHVPRATPHAVASLVSRKPCAVRHSEPTIVLGHARAVTAV